MNDISIIDLIGYYAIYFVIFCALTYVVTKYIIKPVLGLDLIIEQLEDIRKKVREIEDSQGKVSEEYVRKIYEDLGMTGEDGNDLN